MSRFLLLVCALFSAPQLYGQIGGTNIFSFLDLSTNARQAGLGGENVSHTNPDVNWVFQNPALVSEETLDQLAFNYHRFVGSVDHFSLAYCDQPGNWPILSVGLQFLDYGNFDGFDQSGNPTGEFVANEYQLIVGTNHQVGHFRIGVNAKYAGSVIAGSAANAFLLDLGGIFEHPDHDLSAGLAIRNLGWMVQNYSGSTNPDLPLNVLAGVTFKPTYMPFRFTFTLHHLNRWDLNRSAGQINNGNPDGVDKILKHLIVGTELILSKNVIVNAGYNHMERKELGMEQVTGGAGFSLGFLVKTSRFSFGYAHSFHHVSGGSNFLTISSDLKTIIKKKTLED